MNCHGYKWGSALLATALVVGCGTALSTGDRPHLLADTTPPYVLHLPAPGISSEAELPAKAAEEQRKGIRSAEAGDWTNAISAFREARFFAHCAPSIVFNLALAYDKGGQSVPALLWYKAYNVAMPEAPNAIAVRQRVAQLKQEIEGIAKRYLDQGEELAGKLSDRALIEGGKSQRQAVQEQMIQWYFLAGQSERAEALITRLRSTPQSLQADWARARAVGRVYTALMGRDIDGVQRANDSAILSNLDRAGALARVYARNSRAFDAWRSLNSLTGKEVNVIHNVERLFEELRWARAHEAIADLQNRVLEAGDGWRPKLFKMMVSDMELAFWDGRPDIATITARRLKNWFQRYDIGYERFEDRPLYFVVLAVLGDLTSLEQESQQVTSSYYKWADVESIAPLLFATRPPSDMPAITRILERFWSKFAAERKMTDTPGADPYVPVPLYPHEGAFRYSSYLHSYLSGDSRRATLIFDEYNFTYDVIAKEVLRFAVTTNFTQLALYWAARMNGSDERLYLLHRLAISDNSDLVRQHVIAAERDACQGWRPKDTEHGRAFWTALKSAADLEYEHLSKGGAYNTQLEDLSKMSSDKPDAIPIVIFLHGFGLLTSIIWQAE